MANPKSYRSRNIILLVTVLAVIVVSISLVVFYILPQQGANSSASSICSGDLSVGAGEFTYKSFQIASGKSTAFIVGSFSTTGSSTGSDISAFILNQTSFQLFQNTTIVIAPLYDSGVVSSGKFNVSLPTNSLEYYFVFDNGFDSAATKTVNCTASLLYS
jgi:hypothetical protein